MLMMFPYFLIIAHYKPYVLPMRGLAMSKVSSDRISERPPGALWVWDALCLAQKWSCSLPEPKIHSKVSERLI